MKKNLISTDFENAVCIAISLGGDSDTPAAISGSIAKASYGIPGHIKKSIVLFRRASFMADRQPGEILRPG